MPFPSSFSTITFLDRLDETFPIETFARCFLEKNRRSSRTYFDGNLLSNVFRYRGSWRITVVDFYPVIDIRSNVITYHTSRLLTTSDTYGYIVLFSIQMSYVEIIFCPVLPYQLSLHMHVPVRNHTLVDTLLWSARFFSPYNDSFDYERTTRNTNISCQLLTNHRSSITNHYNRTWDYFDRQTGRSDIFLHFLFFHIAWRGHTPFYRFIATNSWQRHSWK